MFVLYFSGIKRTCPGKKINLLSDKSYCVETLYSWSWFQARTKTVMSMMTSATCSNNFKTFLLFKKSGNVCLLANCQGYLISKIKICLLKMMVKPRNLKAIPVLVNQRAVIKMGFLLWCSVAALMFPITLHMVQLFTDYKKSIQMLKQDVFFTLKWQADCQFLQLVILCKGRKRSLIITIYCVWTLRCDRLSTWELTGMNSSPWDWGKTLGKADFCKGEELVKQDKAPSTKIGNEASRK